MKYKDENGNWQSISVKVMDSFPVGGMVGFGGSIAPQGWLICDGQAISRTKYKKLFDVIGTAYGEGDGSTTFNLPNSKGRVLVGLDTSQEEFNAIGKTGGEKAHQLTSDELPRITGKFAPVVPGNYGNFVDGIVTLGQKVGTAWQPQANANADVYGYNISFGNNQPHNNMPPYFVANYIIKAEESVANTSKNENVYSEEETIIGYVIKNDKKIPLYRKELRYIGTIANDVTVNHGIDNLDEMFNAYGWVRKYGWMPIPTVHNYLAGFIGFGAFNSTTFTWYVGNDIQAGLVDVLIKVTLEYTKTTD